LRPGGLALTAHALALCDLPRDARVLDLGCGIGTTLNYLNAEHRLAEFGIDASLEKLSHARLNNPGLALIQSIAEQLPMTDASVDAILAECTLSLFDANAALRECKRVLKRDGYLIANDVYARDEAGIAALRQLPAESCINNAMSQSQIVAQLEAHGFRIVTWQDQSPTLKTFTAPSLSFDSFLAASRAKLGYYLLVAQKIEITNNTNEHE
jgi:SAM-dependent methyltransferase